MKEILIVAAENSAENYAAQIVAEFKQAQAPVHFFGVGGDRMAEQGVELLFHNKELSIVGIIEVVSSILKLKRLFNKLVTTALTRQTTAVLLIDYPDFNLRLAKKFKRAGIPVYYYISPTVWAWRYSRVHTIKKYIHHLFIIFPFEIPIYTREGIPFTYTGHPLLPMIRTTQSKEEFRLARGIPTQELMICLLPGSRLSEIHFLLPVMLAAVAQLQKQFKLTICLLKADNIDLSLIQSLMKQSSVHTQVFSQADGYNLIHAADVVLTTCGTSNLEIAMLGVPFTAVYRVNKLSYILGKRFVKIALYSIVNILAGEEVVKELIQKNFTPTNIVDEITRILTVPGVREKMLADFQRIRQLLHQEHFPPEIIRQQISKDLCLTA